MSRLSVPSMLAFGVVGGLAWTASACPAEPAPDAQPPGWSVLVAAPDTVLLDAAGVEWVSSDARVRLRMAPSATIPRRESAPGPVVTVETKHDISCVRREVRDLGVRTVGITGEVLGDSAVRAPVWVPASAHPTLRDLVPALCARLSLLHPRGLHNLLGSDRP